MSNVNWLNKVIEDQIEQIKNDVPQRRDADYFQGRLGALIEVRHLIGMLKELNKQ